MLNRPLHALSLIDIATAIRYRKVSAMDVTQHMLERIAQLDQHYGSYLTVTAERALEQAKQADIQLDKGIWKGWLHGVPIALKDLCYTNYAPTTAGMTIYRDFMPNFSATVVQRLENSGAVSLGKLSMTESAFLDHHPEIQPPINPWNPDYWTGVSSSGSGVATAAGLCYGSLGSDTGGSIRFPSAHCGLTGIKPTWGRVSRYGVFPLAESLDHLGTMARSAADAAVMLQSIAGLDRNDPTSLCAPVPNYLSMTWKDIRGLRIGLDKQYALDGVASDVSTALLEAINVLEHQGARIIDIKSPNPSFLVQHWGMACAVETAHAHLATYPKHKARYGPGLAGLIELGRDLSASEFFNIQCHRLEFSGALAAMFDDVDCMLIPTLTQPPLSLEEVRDTLNQALNGMDLTRYTSPFDFSGSPTICLPNGIASNGMPLSMQFVGPHLSEGTLIRVAHTYQQATDWHTRVPIGA